MGKELKGTEERMREEAVKKGASERWDEMVYNRQGTSSGNTEQTFATDKH